MTYGEVINLVLSNPFENWVYFDETGEFVLKCDVNLRITRSEIDYDEDTFNEEWAVKHPDPKAYKREYTIYYNNSRIEQFYLVSVDGLRATIPMPKRGTNNITKHDYLLARAVNIDGDRLDEYIKRSGLEVEK